MSEHIEYRGGGLYILYDRDGYAFRAFKRPRDSFWLARPSHMCAALDRRDFTARTLGDLGRMVAAASQRD